MLESWFGVMLLPITLFQRDEGENNRSDRGIALLQYDPHSGINGQDAPGFRLFYQQAITSALI